ncbi:MAG: hypothetical protein GX846_07225, partial [Deltaproteobacteria bacterium]|nr:hypothetical protein [Deltaproteobacteria bacterium]
MNTILHNLLLLGIFLVLVCAPVTAQTSGQPGSAAHENFDTRLLPWIGSWRLLSSGAGPDQNKPMQEFLLTISPGNSENSLSIKGYRNGELSAEETISVDGLRHQITEGECT